MSVYLSQEEVRHHFRWAELKQAVQLGLLSQEAADELLRNDPAKDIGDIAILQAAWTASSPKVRKTFLSLIGAKTHRRHAST